MSAGELQQMLDEMAARLGMDVRVSVCFDAFPPDTQRYTPCASVSIVVSRIVDDGLGEGDQRRGLSHQLDVRELERFALGPIARLRTEIEKLAIRFRRLLETTEAA